MTTDRAVMFFAGSMTLLSVFLVWLVSPGGCCSPPSSAPT